MLHVFLINTNAGKNNYKEIGSIIKEYCLSTGADFKIEFVSFKEDTKDVISRYKERDDVTVYSVGGDGTLNEIVNCIANTKLKLSVIPTGTGNDFYRSLDEYEGKKIDLGLVNDKYFINVASLGIDANIANTANELKLKNKKAKNIYTYSILKNFFPYKALSMNVNNVDKLITIVTICNGRFYGGGYPIAPNAMLNDGLFDVYEVGNINKLQTIGLIAKLSKGKHVDAPNVHCYRTNKVTIDSFHELNCNVDGEIIKGTTFNFTMDTKAIEIAKDELKIKEFLKKKSIIK